MTCNPRGGFSYIEILIALALFSIIFASSLMVINQSARNMAFARDGYAAHLAAQSLMLVTRETFENTGSAAIATAIANYAQQRGVKSYSIWIFGETPVEFHSSCAPEADASLTGLAGMNISGQASIIVTVVWNEYGNAAGRAIGATSQ